MKYRIISNNGTSSIKIPWYLSKYVKVIYDDLQTFPWCTSAIFLGSGHFFLEMVYI